MSTSIEKSQINSDQVHLKPYFIFNFVLMETFMLYDKSDNFDFDIHNVRFLNGDIPLSHFMEYTGQTGIGVATKCGRS